MDADLPALFDLPEPVPGSTDRRIGRGRARETYRRTVTADVWIERPEELRQAALNAFETGIVAEFDSAEHEDEVKPAGDDEHVVDDPRADIATSDASALSWMIEPTTGHWELPNEDAFQLVGGSVTVEPGEDGRCRAAWSAVIKLRDARAFRKSALAKCPAGDTAAREEADKSLAAAWNLLVDPYGPIRDVSGIVWKPGSVSVEQVLARPNRSL